MEGLPSSGFAWLGPAWLRSRPSELGEERQQGTGPWALWRQANTDPHASCICQRRRAKERRGEEEERRGEERRNRGEKRAEEKCKGEERREKVKRREEKRREQKRREQRRR